MSNIIVWSELSQKEREKLLENHRLWLEKNGGERADLLTIFSCATFDM